jgi:hypothetical protein
MSFDLGIRGVPAGKYPRFCLSVHFVQPGEPPEEDNPRFGRFVFV